MDRTNYARAFIRKSPNSPDKSCQYHLAYEKNEAHWYQARFWCCVLIGISAAAIVIVVCFTDPKVEIAVTLSLLTLLFAFLVPCLISWVKTEKFFRDLVYTCLKILQLNVRKEKTKKKYSDNQITDEECSKELEECDKKIGLVKALLESSWKELG